LEAEEYCRYAERVYVQVQKKGKNVARLTLLQPQEREQGIPPQRNTYIAVADADLTAKEAERLTRRSPSRCSRAAAWPWSWTRRAPRRASGR
jgi:hypothetical protein